MIFAQCNRRQAANIVLEGLGSMTAPPSARGSLPARSEILTPKGLWRTIERNAPEVFKLAIALNLTGRMGMPEKVAARILFISRPAAGAPEPTSSSMARSPSLSNEPDPIWLIGSGATGGLCVGGPPRCVADILRK